MDSAQTIRDAVSRVSVLRSASQSEPGLRRAVTAVKRFQAQRFAYTYEVELRTEPFQNAARFFLEELYSDKDYALRDAQFSRIAGALQSVFPKQVVHTAVSLAQLHALTEELDHAMGFGWLQLESSMQDDDKTLYAEVWRNVGRRVERELQLSSVLKVGQELAHLTRTPGLRMMLKMMRRPAQAAGLSVLQQFLESGFDTFAKMSRERDEVTDFLNMIRMRESKLIDLLFSGKKNALSIERAFPV